MRIVTNMTIARQKLNISVHRTRNNSSCVLCGPCYNAVLNKHVQTSTGQQCRSGVFYVVRAETVVRQQLAHQWTGWVAITWEPQ
jgi:hypothetical protein